MRFVILHYHILKNAGSTVEEFLDRSFGDRFYRYDKPERAGTIPPAELRAFIEANPRIQAYSSHQIRHPLPHAPGILFFDLCFLRDPLDRVRSMYDYFRKRPAPGDPLSDLACSTSLGDFIAGVVTDHTLYISNVQVNLLAQAGDSDEPTRADLALARDRILRTSFPGVVDLYDESVVSGEYFLRAAFPALHCALPPVNVSKGLDSTLDDRIAHLRSVCHPAIFARLVEINQLDYELLACAREEVRRRFSLVPDAAARLDEFRRRVAAGPQPPALPDKTRRFASVFRTAPRPEQLFDAHFYLDQNPDVRAAGIDPLLHYRKHGAAEGRKPHPWFDPAFYLSGLPAEARTEAASNPLAHYLRHSAASPHPLFDGPADRLIEYLATKPPAPATAQSLTISDIAVDVAIQLDQAGRTQVTAPPTMRRFFGSLNYDQVAALARS